MLIFAIGGFADSVWHTLFGIEVDIEALMSPPHLVLLAGAMLIVTTPARAAWRGTGSDPSLREFAPALTSATLATLLVGFFLMYASGLFDFHAMASFADAFAPGGVLAGQPFLQEVLTGFGVAARLLTTVILLVPVLLILRRWTPPAGTFTVFLTAFVAFMLVLEDFRLPEMLAAGVVAGVVADVLVARLRSAPRDVTIRVLAPTIPAVLWLTHFAALAAIGELGWPFVVWGGVVLLAAGTGLALSLLVVGSGRAGSPASRP